LLKLSLKKELKLETGNHSEKVKSGPVDLKVFKVSKVIYLLICITLESNDSKRLVNPPPLILLSRRKAIFNSTTIAEGTDAIAFNNILPDKAIDIDPDPDPDHLPVGNIDASALDPKIVFSLENLLSSKK
jgi:hypothetical protein